MSSLRSHVTSFGHSHVMSHVHSCHVIHPLACHICPLMSCHICSHMSHYHFTGISHPFTHISHQPSTHITSSIYSNVPLSEHYSLQSHVITSPCPPLSPPPSPPPSPLGAIVLRYFGRPYISASPAYKQYLCLFCKDIPHQPCTLKCCGKVSCRDCGKGAGTCPGCGGRVTLVTDAPLERRIKEVRVFCPNAGRGCLQLRSMSLMDVIKHR